MDKAKDEAINKLNAGQEKMGNDITELKVDVSELKADVSQLKHGQQRLESDVTELKHGQQRLESDVSELRQGQQHLETMMLRMIEEVTFVKKVVIKMENDLIPQVKTLFDADKVRHYDTTELKQICREQDKKLGDHELRITRLEQ